MKFLKNTFSNKAACSPTPTLSLPYPPSLFPFLTLPYPPSLSPFLTLPPYLPSCTFTLSSFSLPSSYSQSHLFPSHSLFLPILFLITWYTTIYNSKAGLIPCFASQTLNLLPPYFLFYKGEECLMHIFSQVRFILEYICPAGLVKDPHGQRVHLRSQKQEQHD